MKRIGGRRRRLGSVGLLLALCFLLPSPASPQQPLTLPQVLSLALEKNPLLLAWEAQVRAGEAEVLSARAFPNPELSLGAGRIIRYDPGRLVSSLELSQTLELPGKRRYRRQAAEQGLSALTFQREEQKRALLFEVKRAFYDLLLAQKALEVAQDNLNSTQVLLSSAKVRVEVGEAAEFELIKAQVEVARARNEVEKASSRVNLARAALNTLLARPPSSPLEIAGELESPPRRIDLPQLLLKVEQEHPLLRQQERMVAQQESLLSLAKSSRYPDPTFSGFYQKEPDQELLGLSLSLPLPLWYRQQGEIGRAAAERARAEAELFHLKNDLCRQLTEAYQGYRIAQELVRTFTEQLLKQAEESRRIAEISYREGASSILDLIEAQRTARQTFLDYQQALYELKVAEAAMERVGGELGE
jgi:cobalt-zinc-cadmium efflux system outer membrane protein